MWANLLHSTLVAATTWQWPKGFLIGEVIIWVEIWWKWISQRSQRSIIISLLLNSSFEVVTSFCRYRFVIPSLDWRVCAHFFKAYLYITHCKSSYTSTGEYGGWIYCMILTRQSDSKEHYICVDVIEDCINDDKDVIMKLTLCIVRDIVFTTYIFNALAPKQVDIGLDNSAEYTILVCCDASYQIIVINMTEMSRFWF